MKGVLVVLLAALLLGVVGILPAIATGEVATDATVTEEEQEKISNVRITEKMMEEAKPADAETIKIEIAREMEELRPWEKYLYLDADQNLNENSQTFWTRVGTRKGSFDFSVGWSQKFNEPEEEPTDKGMVSMSISYWW